MWPRQRPRSERLAALAVGVITHDGRERRVYNDRGRRYWQDDYYGQRRYIPDGYR